MKHGIFSLTILLSCLWNCLICNPAVAQSDGQSPFAGSMQIPAMGYPMAQTAVPNVISSGGTTLSALQISRQNMETLSPLNNMATTYNEVPGTPGLPSTKDEQTDDDEEEEGPLGDALLPLCLMGMLYFLVRRKRRKALLC